jgi:hypothetical protein
MLHPVLPRLLRLPLLESLLATNHLPQVPRRQKLTSPEVVPSVENNSQTQDTQAVSLRVAVQSNVSPKVQVD